MKMKHFLILTLFISFLSCISLSNKSIIQTVKPALIEKFVDSVQIGRKGLNKIEISLFSLEDSTYCELNFYSRISEKWILQNSFDFERNAYQGLDCKISDFNNDGFNDFTFISSTAARGANEIRTLYIYDNSKDQMIWIKNSEYFPNMSYNKWLDCIDAMRFYGGCSTDFVKIKGDSLVMFASVELTGSEVIVETYDSTGKSTEIYKDSSDLYYERFKNYNPLVLYTEEDFKN